MGDFAQLPPVMGKPLYSSPKLFKTPFNANESKASIHYKMFKNVVILDVIMRQQGDDEKQFREVFEQISGFWPIIKRHCTVQNPHSWKDGSVVFSVMYGAPSQSLAQFIIYNGVKLFL